MLMGCVGFLVACEKVWTLVEAYTIVMCVWELVHSGDTHNNWCVCHETTGACMWQMRVQLLCMDGNSEHVHRPIDYMWCAYMCIR